MRGDNVLGFGFGKWDDHVDGSEARANSEGSSSDFTILDPTNWIEPAPRRKWLVQDWIPIGYATGLYGDGAIGKSTLVQQLMTSVATGLPWLGLDVERGPAFGMLCEDDADELHRRQEKINAAYGLQPSDLSGLHYCSRVGQDNLLMVFDGADQGELTSTFLALEKLLVTIRPRLVVLDTLADVFGGDEIRRSHARQFVQGVGGRLATTLQCAVVICAHPSLSGMASGTGSGGSTAWNNTVRSRLYMTTPSAEEGETADPDTRILSRKKANYAPRDGEISLRWNQGCFDAEGISRRKGKVIEWDTIEQIFQEIDRAWRSGTPYSNAPQTKNHGRYLPLWANQQFGLETRLVSNHVQKWLANRYLAYEEYDAHAKKSGLRVLKFLRPGEEK